MGDNNQWPLEANAKAFYGDPTKSNAVWQAKNIVMIKPPFQLYYDGQKVRGVRIHEKCARSLAIIFAAIWEVYGKDQDKIDATGITNYSGTYCYRPVRGSNRLSLHAFAAAIDFDAAHNGQTFDRKAGRLKSGDPIVEIFKAEGWRWGGDYKGKRDPMHFEAVR